MTSAQPAGTDHERIWGGTTLAERRASRRKSLLDAALDLIGESGGAGVTIRSVCKRTGLTPRYFYESFAGRDELMVALFEEVAAEANETFQAASAQADPDLQAQARVMLDTFAAVTLDDARKGRLLLVESLSDPALREVSVASVPIVTRWMRAQLPGAGGGARRTMTAVGIATAIAGLFSTWLAGGLKVSREELVDHCVSLVLVAYAAQAASTR